MISRTAVNGFLSALIEDMDCLNVGRLVWIFKSPNEGRGSFLYQKALINHLNLGINHKFFGSIGQLDDLVRLKKLYYFVIRNANWQRHLLSASYISSIGTQWNEHLGPSGGNFIISLNSVDHFSRKIRSLKWSSKKL